MFKTVWKNEWPQLKQQFAELEHDILDRWMGWQILRFSAFGHQIKKSYLACYAWIKALDLNGLG